jgi:hypothetical protein
MNVNNPNINIISRVGVPGCRNFEALSVNELTQMMLQLYATGTRSQRWRWHLRNGAGFAAIDSASAGEAADKTHK